VGLRLSRFILVAAIAMIVVGRPRVWTADAVSVSSLLDPYLSGRFDEAVKAAAAVDDAGDVRAAIVRDGRAWILAGPDPPRRRLAAAAFALEFTHARLETDWRRLWPLLEWGCDQFRAGGPPTEAERTWQLAVIAVSGRARDFGRLENGPQPDWARGPTQQRIDLDTLRTYAGKTGHLGHAIGRFPDEPRLLLATARLSFGLFPEEPTRNARGVPPPNPGEFRRNARLRALAFLDAIRAHPALALEAHMRAGHIHYAIGSYSTALNLERLALAGSPDARTAYLAHFVAGRVLVAMKRPDEAAREFEQAIALQPRAQSAILSLSALQASSAVMTPSFTALRRALDSHDPFDDPWRLFGYGDYPRWPELRAALRGAIK
jgi:tetratricopeptide (TPR) repeat protein